MYDAIRKCSTVHLQVTTRPASKRSHWEKNGIVAAPTRASETAAGKS